VTAGFCRIDRSFVGVLDNSQVIRGQIESNDRERIEFVTSKFHEPLETMNRNKYGFLKYANEQ
jgi:hypothetical protein